MVPGMLIDSNAENINQLNYNFQKDLRKLRCKISFESYPNLLIRKNYWTFFHESSNV